MLHDIREFNPNFYPERYRMPYFLTPYQFDNLLQNLINNKNRILTFNDSFFFSEEVVNQGLYFLTFDDGLKDHLYVARILKKANIKAAFFIPSGPIFEHSIIDSHKIQFILASTEPSKLVRHIQISFQEYFNKDSSFLDEYFVSRWKNNIWSRDMVFVTRVMREFPDSFWKRSLLSNLFLKFVTSDTKSFSAEFYLNFEDVNEIINMGHYIGGHGHYSYDLRFEKIDVIEEELDRMDNFLSKYVQEKKMYAYANGGYNDFIVKQVISRGYDFAFITGHRNVSIQDSNWLLPRIDATKTELILE